MEATMLCHRAREAVGVALLRRFSIELTVKDVAALQGAPTGLYQGACVSVSRLPRDCVGLTANAASRLLALGYTPMPHIVARSLGSAADLEQQLFELARQGVAERVFIVAGDLPSPKGPFPDALSVICSGLLEQHGVGHVGISGYPSGHPTIDEKRLCQAMEHKLVALSDRSLTSSIVTQFSFDPNAVMDWLDVVRARGIDIPIRLGVPGPASTTALLRFSARCGVQASAKAMRRFGFSLARLVDTSGPDQLVRHMAARFNPTVHGDVALHFYPFGGVAKTLDWLGAFGARK